MSGVGPALVLLRTHWRSLLLVASLGLNLVIGGIAAAHLIWPDRGGRFGGATYTQLLPRKFLGDLDEPRRKELLQALSDYRTRYRDSRREMGAAAERLAQALKAEPYVPAAAAGAVRAFEDIGKAMIANGSAAALDLIGRLTVEERHALAVRISERARRPSRR